MHFIPYNSRKKYHLSPGAAVRSGEDMIFRIVLPRSEQCSAVRLILETDGGGREDFSFSWERMQGENEEWWRLETAAPENAGIVWYFFEYDTPWGTKKISLESNGNAVIGEGSRWRLTVCCENCDTPLWLRGGTMYQIFPDRFCRSGKTPLPENKPAAEYHSRWGEEPDWEPDSDGKIEKYDFFGGDLKGIEEKLGYLESLGVTCIYLNPIFSARSNHRYDTGDYMKIDPMLGTEEDFKSLCKSAEEHGIKILLDGVFSHTGADSRYFDKFSSYGGKGAYCDKNSPYRSWYNFRCWPDDYACWWGVDILPELNETDPGVLAFLTGENGVARHWLRLGASGWRLDVADELPDEFLDRFHEAVRKEKKDAFIYGEVWEDATDKISYGHRRRYLEGGELDSVMNYPFANAVIDFARTANAEELRECVENIVEHYPRASLDTLMNHIGTHDTVRAITRLGRGDIERPENGRDRGILTEEQYQKGVCLLKLASVLQFTLPGVPCVYYGDEAGLTGGEDPFNRACFPWGNENAELLDHYRTLGRIRKLCPAFIDGEFNCISSALGCIAYERNSESGSALIIANANCHGIEYTVPERWRGASALFGSAADERSVPLGAYSAAILYK